MTISNKNISNEEIGNIFLFKIKEFINSKFESNFVNMDWQVSVLDRKNGYCSLKMLALSQSRMIFENTNTRA